MIIGFKKMITSIGIGKKDITDTMKGRLMDTDLPPKNCTRYNVSLKGQKRGGINGQKGLHSGTNH